MQFILWRSIWYKIVVSTNTLAFLHTRLGSVLRGGEFAGHVAEGVNYAEQQFRIVFVFICCGEQPLVGMRWLGGSRSRWWKSGGFCLICGRIPFVMVHAFTYSISYEHEGGGATMSIVDWERVQHHPGLELSLIPWWRPEAVVCYVRRPRVPAKTRAVSPTCGWPDRQRDHAARQLVRPLGLEGNVAAQPVRPRLNPALSHLQGLLHCARYHNMSPHVLFNMYSTQFIRWGRLSSLSNDKYFGQWAETE